MKNCMYNKWNKLSFFLFFYSYASIIFPMELHSPNYGTRQEPIKPYNKYLMNRDEKEALKHNVPWKKVVPKEIIIVPTPAQISDIDATATDGQTAANIASAAVVSPVEVVMSRIGEILHFKCGYGYSWECLFEPELAFGHPRMSHAPFIAVALKPKTSRYAQPSLVLVSAGNYRHPITQQLISEYTVGQIGQASEPKRLDVPLNQIRLNSTGTILVLIHSPYAVVQDLENGSRSPLIRPTKNDNSMIDVAISSDSMEIFFAENQGIIQYGTLRRMCGPNSNETRVKIIKKVMTGNIINEIKFVENPDNKTLYSILCSTLCDGTTIIDPYDLFENSPVDMSPERVVKNGPIDAPYLTPIERRTKIIIKGGNVKSFPFSNPLHYNSVVLDQGAHFATAHWNKEGSKQERRTIEVYRKAHNGKCEKFVFTVPELEETYNYITEDGRRKIGVGHLVRVALRGNRLVAFGTDGKLYLFEVPEASQRGIPVIPETNQCAVSEIIVPEATETTRSQRRRSKSLPPMFCSAGEEFSSHVPYKPNFEPVSENPECISTEENIVDKKSETDVLDGQRKPSYNSGKIRRKTASPSLPLHKTSSTQDVHSPQDIHSPKKSALVGIFNRKNSGSSKNSPLSSPRSKPKLVNSTEVLRPDEDRGRGRKKDECE